ncbi:MAG: hypothetical protein IKP73_01955 [Bacteroidales bacterium]|nr:hypothetical protein [Bacteroidales bacterium]MBR4324273.1 hypothetical protein [Bacteroidales bacterium]
MAQLIANPIYDSAFKYMMQNERAATVLLESLLDKVRDKNTGETELVTIELQKSYLDTEIMRFRTYLGQQYSDIKKTDAEMVDTWRKNKNNGQIERVSIEKRIPLHIVAIYILGHTFQEIDLPKPVIYNYPDPRGIEKKVLGRLFQRRAIFGNPKNLF